MTQVEGKCQFCSESFPVSFRGRPPMYCPKCRANRAPYRLAELRSALAGECFTPAQARALASLLFQLCNEVRAAQQSGTVFRG